MICLHAQKHWETDLVFVENTPILRTARKQCHTNSAVLPIMSAPFTHTHARTHTHNTCMHAHAHRHTFNGPLSGWAGTKKAKPIWILLKQETVSGSGISWAVCKSAPRQRDNHASTPPLSFFTGRMPFLPPNQQRQSTEGCTHTLRE